MSKLPIVERLERGVFKISDEPGGYPIFNNVDASQSMRQAANTITELVSALEECQQALATMVEPNAIRTTTTINAYAMAHQAEARARTALSNTRGDTKNEQG